MKIGTRLTIFVALLLILTVGAIITPIYMGTGKILTESSRRSVASDAREMEEKIVGHFERAQGELVSMVADTEVQNLMKIAKFTKKYAPLEKKMSFVRTLLGYDTVHVYDRKGGCVVATDGNKEGKLPDFGGKPAIGSSERRLVAAEGTLKMKFFAPIHYRKKLYGTMVLTENIDSEFARGLLGAGNRYFAVYERDGEGYALRAASGEGGFGSVAVLSGARGIEGVHEGYDLGGKMGTASFSPLPVGESGRLLMGFFEDTSEITAIRSQVARIALLVGVCALVAGILLVTTCSLKLSRVIGRLTEFSEAIARGDLSSSLSIRRKDEIGVLCAAQNRMAKNMGGLIGRVVETSDSLFGSARDLSAVSGLMARGAGNVTAQVNNTAAASEELSRSMGTIAVSMEVSARGAGEILRDSRNMAGTLGRLGDDGDEVRRITGEAVGEAEASVKALEAFETAFSEINKTVESIREISAHTNILALNAGIQASKNDGDRRGFKVVVEEIKALAAETARATHTIRDKMEKVDSSARLTSQTIAGSLGVISRVNRRVEEIVEGIREQEGMSRGIVDNVGGVAGAVSEVSENIAQASAVSGDIARDMAASGAACELISTGASTVLENAGLLTGLSADLNDLVSCFVLRKKEAPRLDMPRMEKAVAREEESCGGVGMIPSKSAA